MKHLPTMTIVKTVKAFPWSYSETWRRDSSAVFDQIAALLSAPASSAYTIKGQ